MSFDIENNLAFEPGQFDIVASVVVCGSDTTDLVELDGATSRLNCNGMVSNDFHLSYRSKERSCSQHTRMQVFQERLSRERQLTELTYIFL